MTIGGGKRLWRALFLMLIVSLDVVVTRLRDYSYLNDTYGYANRDSEPPLAGRARFSSAQFGFEEARQIGRLGSLLPEHSRAVVFAIKYNLLFTIVVEPGQQKYYLAGNWSRISQSIESVGDLYGLHANANQPLYEALIAPWLKDLPKSDVLYFVPTASLFDVPFGALVDPKSSRLLLDDHAYSVSPSVTELIRALRIAYQLQNQPIRSVQVVGAPTLGGSAETQLPGALEEVEAISEVYGREKVRLLRQKQATPARVLAGLGNADIVHFALHSCRSALYLCPDFFDTGHLSSEHVRRYKLSHTKLAVLAGCDTLVGPLPRVSDSGRWGVLGLGSAFLEAGVPAVVGSLFPVADHSLPRMFVRFHQEIRAGTDPMNALRLAQIEARDVSADPSDLSWAGFEVFGAAIAHQPVELPPAGQRIPSAGSR